jgi:hypothetical protein
VTSEKDRLAAEVEDRWLDFQMALSDKRRYPPERFRNSGRLENATPN